MGPFPTPFLSELRQKFSIQPPSDQTSPTDQSKSKTVSDDIHICSIVKKDLLTKATNITTSSNTHPSCVLD